MNAAADLASNEAPPRWRVIARPLLKLLLLVSILWGISTLKVMRDAVGSGVLLAAGALLLTGIFAGKVAAPVGLPRLTGYLFIGIVVGPHLLGFIPAEGVDGLELVKGLAVSLIGLTAGAELRLRVIRSVGAVVARVGAQVIGVVFLSIVAAALLAKPLIPFLAPLGWGPALAVAALLASIVVSFSPTVTIAVLQETRARGPFSEFLLSIVIIGDLLVILAFAICGGVTKAVFGGRLDLGSIVGGLGWEVLGSTLVGVLVGLFTALYMRFGKDVAVFLVAVCFAVAEMGLHLHLSPLLVALAAGATIANLDDAVAQKVHAGSEQAGLPVYALFFAAAGASLHLDVLVVVGPVAVLLVAIRGGALYLACRRFAPARKAVIRDNLWMGLVSQAGVTFGLAAVVRRSFPGFGAELETLIIAMVTLHELVGPVLTRRALANAGEMGPELAGARAAH